MTALWEQDAITLAGMLRGREVSAREVIAAHIGRIEAVDTAVNAAVTPGGVPVGPQLVGRRRAD